MAESARPKSLFLEFEGGGKARARLLWDEAPKTCEAIVGSLPMTIMACHARHSGGEALFLTPTVIPLGDENTTLDYHRGDICFGYEPKYICEHAKEDVSEVAWMYHEAVQPRRWVSTSGDPTNQTGPFKTVDVPLNLFAKVEEEDGFFEKSARLPRLGEQTLKVTAA